MPSQEPPGRVLPRPPCHAPLEMGEKHTRGEADAMGLLKALAVIGLVWLALGGLIAVAIICVAGTRVRRTWRKIDETGGDR